MINKKNDDYLYSFIDPFDQLKDPGERFCLKNKEEC